MRWTHIAALIGIVLLTTADPAQAWGPATHTRLALDAVASTGLLSASLLSLLSRNLASYIFGNIAADVVFAKRLSRVRQFCHHWSTGFEILERAEVDADRAFAYGYLSHLAADTVAHNKYIPRQLTTTRATLNFGHLYWEMRADGCIDASDWRKMEEVLAADHEHHHRTLAKQLTLTLLPYHVNRRLFDRINRTVTRDYWKSCMRAWYRCSRWDLNQAMLALYHRESVERMISVLRDGEQSPIVREDPNGNTALHLARLHRSDGRRLRRRGLPTGDRISEAAAAFAPSSSRLFPDYEAIAHADRLDPQAVSESEPNGDLRISS